MVLKNNQNGGQRGCSTYHFLADAIDNITEHMEDSRAASVLTSIDYSKAFNRVEHLPLLQAFKRKGAPNHIINILAVFLTKRTMKVKVGNCHSDKKYVNAGAPQGSVLGTYVFNVATDNLEDGLDEQLEQDFQLTEGDLSFLETQSDETRAASTPNKAAPPNIQTTGMSPIPERNTSDRFVILPNTKNVPEKLRKRIEPAWRNKQVTVRKFVDDNLQIDKVNMQRETTMMDTTTGQAFKNPRVLRSERMFNHISRQASKQGLVVNAAKTNLLVVSASKSYNAQAHFYDQNNEKIDCVTELKALTTKKSGRLKVCAENRS